MKERLCQVWWVFRSFRILYISYDGLLDPLGASQILPYVLNIASSSQYFHIVSFEKNDTVLIIDDLMATGGTIKAVIDMCDELEVKVKAVACIMDLPKLGGSDYVKNLNIPFYAGVVY